MSSPSGSGVAAGFFFLVLVFSGWLAAGMDVSRMRIAIDRIDSLKEL